MHEVVQLTLENEIDLIVAHRRTMRLAELVGLGLSTQTTFATAVSEVVRFATEDQHQAHLLLGLTEVIKNQQYLIAKVTGQRLADVDPKSDFASAQRLVEKIKAGPQSLSLYISLSSPQQSLIDVDRWRVQLTTESSLSPYDELKRRNDQLQELAQNLQASETQFSAVINSLPLMIYTANVDGEISYANQWLEQYMNVPINQLNETKWANVIHPDDWDRVQRQWDECTKKRLPFRCEYRIQRGDTDAYEWHLDSAVPAQNDQPHPSRYNGFIVNIQAQKNEERVRLDNEELLLAKQQLEESQLELKATIAELNRSNTELEHFAYMASHDLQEPLRKIQTYGKILASKHETALNADGIDKLHRMQDAAGRMQQLINDLLSYSRLTTQQQPFQSVNLDLLIETIVKNELESVLAETGATVEWEALPRVQGDERQIQQLFQNLLSNALKFVPPQRIPHVRLAFTENAKPSRANSSTPYVAITVTDNGIGIEEPFRERIFNVFQRLHGRSEYPGMGIGLAIAKKVVENHNGWITVDSQVGHSTTFTIYLPAAE